MSVSDRQGDQEWGKRGTDHRLQIDGDDLGGWEGRVLAVVRRLSGSARARLGRASEAGLEGHAIMPSVAGDQDLLELAEEDLTPTPRCGA